MLEPSVVWSGSFCVSSGKGYVGGSEGGAVIVNASCGRCLHACTQLWCCVWSSHIQGRASRHSLLQCQRQTVLQTPVRRQLATLVPDKWGPHCSYLSHAGSAAGNWIAFCGTHPICCHCLVQCWFGPLLRHGLCCRSCVTAVPEAAKRSAQPLPVEGSCVTRCLCLETHIPRPVVGTWQQSMHAWRRKE